MRCELVAGNNLVPPIAISILITLVVDVWYEVSSWRWATGLIQGWKLPRSRFLLLPWTESLPEQDCIVVKDFLALNLASLKSPHPCIHWTSRFMSFPFSTSCLLRKTASSPVYRIYTRRIVLSRFQCHLNCVFNVTLSIFSRSHAVDLSHLLSSSYAICRRVKLTLVLSRSLTSCHLLCPALIPSRCLSSCHTPLCNPVTLSDVLSCSIILPRSLSHSTNVTLTFCHALCRSITLCIPVTFCVILSRSIVLSRFMLSVTHSVYIASWRSLSCHKLNQPVTVSVVLSNCHALSCHVLYQPSSRSLSSITSYRALRRNATLCDHNLKCPGIYSVRAISWNVWGPHVGVENQSGMSLWIQ